MSKNTTQKSGNTKCAFKTTVVGCGSVGATTAYAYVLSGTVTDMVLIDKDKGRAEGLKLDLDYATSFTPHTVIEAGDDFGLCAGSNIVVITAGARQKDGESRLDLANTNKKIFAEIIPKIAKAAPGAILLIVTNPVDIMTYEAIKHSKFPWNRVFGTGTILDSARLQFHISERIQVHPSSVDAYVLGEHGDSSFPVYGSANVLGKPLFDFEGFSKNIADECYAETKNAANRIIHGLGYTCYSIAAAICKITEAIFEDKNQVFPLSVMLQDYYGHSDICLSVPSVLGRSGIREIINVPLNEEEQKRLTKSVKTLRKFI